MISISQRLLPAVASALAVAAWAPATGSAAADERPARSVVTHDVQRAPGKIAEYWTPRRMRRAEPLDVVLRGSGEARRPTAAAGGAKKQPRSHVSYSSSQVTNPEAAGNRTNGKVFAHSPVDGIDYTCSGTAVDADNRSLVITAAHCVFDGGFATNFVFVPGYHDFTRPFGTWAATELFAPSGWTESFEGSGGLDESNFDFDVGAATTATKSGQALQDRVGARGIAFDQPRNQTYDAYGYPVDTNFFTLNTFGGPPFGQTQWKCGSQYAGDDAPDDRGGPAPMSIGCDMTGGASGGGWVVANTVESVNSYGYATEPEHLYGPYFGTAAKCLYKEASGEPPPVADTVLLKHPKRKTRKRKAKFRFELDGSGADLDCLLFSFRCRLDKKAWKDCSSGRIKYRKLRRRRHTFRVKALDQEGAAVGEPAKFKFKVKKKKKRR